MSKPESEADAARRRLKEQLVDLGENPYEFTDPVRILALDEEKLGEVDLSQKVRHALEEYLNTLAPANKQYRSAMRQLGVDPKRPGLPEDDPKSQRVMAAIELYELSMPSPIRPCRQWNGELPAFEIESLADLFMWLDTKILYLSSVFRDSSPQQPVNDTPIHDILVERTIEIAKLAVYDALYLLEERGLEWGLNDIPQLPAVEPKTDREVERALADLRRSIGSEAKSKSTDVPDGISTKNVLVWGGVTRKIMVQWDLFEYLYKKTVEGDSKHLRLHDVAKAVWGYDRASAQSKSETIRKSVGRLNDHLAGKAIRLEWKFSTSNNTISRTL